MKNLSQLIVESLNISHVKNKQIEDFDKIGIKAVNRGFTRSTFELICSPKVPATTNWQSFRTQLKSLNSDNFSLIEVEKMSKDDENYNYLLKYTV